MTNLTHGPLYITFKFTTIIHENKQITHTKHKKQLSVKCPEINRHCIILITYPIKQLKVIQLLRMGMNYETEFCDNKYDLIPDLNEFRVFACLILSGSEFQSLGPLTEKE